MHLSVQHGKSLDEARELMGRAVGQAQAQFGALVQRVEWSTDRDSARLIGTGFEVAMRVDPREVYVSVDVPLLGRLVGNPLLTGLKGILQNTFQKRLTDQR
jgi:hypothetical protein